MLTDDEVIERTGHREYPLPIRCTTESAHPSALVIFLLGIRLSVGFLLPFKFVELLL
jgi:hypothetical protein